jgi:hypothetical protein
MAFLLDFTGILIDPLRVTLMAIPKTFRWCTVPAITRECDRESDRYDPWISLFL